MPALKNEGKKVNLKNVKASSRNVRHDANSASLKSTDVELGKSNFYLI